MPSSFDQEYFDVLRAIEGAIVQAYALHPNLRDADAEDALNGLMRMYKSVLKEKKPPILKLSEGGQAVFDAVKVALEGFMSSVLVPAGEGTISLDEALKCVQRIHRSVKQYRKLHGSGGNAYLEFVKGYQNRT